MASLALTLAANASISAQNIPLPDIAIGNSPLAVYDVNGIDNVNTLNGNVFLNIPLVSFPQSGKDLRMGFHIYYNAKGWAINYRTPGCGESNDGTFHGQWLGHPRGVYVSRDQYLTFDVKSSTVAFHQTSQPCGGPGYINVSTNYLSYNVSSPDGSTHFYRDLAAQNCSSANWPSGCPQTYGTTANTYPATDGSGYRLAPSGSDYSSVVDRSGVTYTVGPNSLPLAQRQYLETISDPNGNTITSSPTGWTDTVSRHIPGTISGPGSISNTLTPSSGEDYLIPGNPASVGSTTCPQGTQAARDWDLTLGGNLPTHYYFCFKQYSYSSAFNLRSLVTDHTFDSVTEDPGQTVQLLSAIMLPNGTSYTFDYDQYLDLTKLTLPSGGSISYTWQTVLFLLPTPPAPAYSAVPPSYYSPASRALASRTVSPGAGQPNETWTYHWYLSRNTNQYPTYNQPGWVVVTDPLGNDTEHQVGGTDDSGQSIGNLAETGVSYYSGCGPHDTASDRSCVNPSQSNNTASCTNLIKSDTYVLTASAGGGAGDYSDAWSATYVPSFKPTTVTTSMPACGANSQVSKRVTTKLPLYGTCYVASMPEMNTNSSAPPSYKTVSPCNLLDQDLKHDVYDFGSGTPGPLVQSDSTSYVWSSGSASSGSYAAANLLDLPSSTIITGSDSAKAETDYGYDEDNPGTAHGNLTSTTKVNLLGPSTRVSAQYYSNGEVKQVTDGRGYTTSITYLCANSLPYQITNPLSQTATYSYDCSTGLLTGYQDPNDAAAGRPGTTYTYDNMRNPIKIIRPSGGGQTSIDYHSYALPTTVTKTVTASPDPDLVSTTNYDGLLRPISVIKPDSSTTENSYDSAGQLHSTTNPHMGSTAATDGTSYYSYDAIGRKTLVTNPDSSTHLWKYSGNMTTETDENGASWIRTSNALGRLIQVVEPGNLRTSYDYDSLGNLKTVTQTGIPGSENARVRSFSYDSLSRLLTSYNPETGTICYGVISGGQCQDGYDENGNLKQKTDARNVTVHYAYDALNRLIGKTYTGTDSAAAIASATAPTKYYFDSIPGVSVDNAIGRLIQETTGVPTSILTQRTILKYDPMGRVLQDQQAVAGASSSQTVLYSYNLSGGLSTWTNGVSTAPVGFATTYDSGGRLSTLLGTDQTRSIQLFEPPLSGPQYGPAGLVSAQLSQPTSSGPAAFQWQKSYDNRFRTVAELIQRAGGSTSSGGSRGSATVTISGAEGYQQVCNVDPLPQLPGGGDGDMNPSPPPDPKCTNNPDTGTVSVTVNGFTASTTYGGFDYPDSVAANLAYALSQAGSPVQASSSGSVVTLTALTGGSASNYHLSTSCYGDFTCSPSGQVLTGGVDSTSGNTSPVIYAYSIPLTGGFAPNGNLLGVTDSVMGNWNYSYDNLNRLLAGQASANTQTGFAPYGGALLQWSYDSFGNNKGQQLSGNTSATATQGNYTYSARNNKVDGASYDASGNMLNYQGGIIIYDAEGRVASTNSGSSVYVYDAEGRRVAKQNGNGQLTKLYVIGLNGEQLSELNGQGVWLHSNAYAAGKLLATYDPTGLHFEFSDWLGTKRVQASTDGTIEEICRSLPFNDSLNCAGPGSDATEQHFTGKERDTESGLDYFGARYYASNMGRFMSPDWAAKAEPVPYAKLTDPQSLNLYSYVGNNPLSLADADGHCSGDDCGKVTVTATTSGNAALTTSNGGRTATVEGTVQYKFTYNGKPLTNTLVHEDISNKSSRDGVPEKAKLTTSDGPTGPANGNPPGVIPDTSSISITTPFGGAGAMMETSVFSKDTTQTLSFQTPTGSACSVTETRSLSNADSKGQPTDTYTIKLTSPVTQKATPTPPTTPPRT